MRLCSKKRILELMRENQFRLANIADHREIFLDDFRIGFRLRETILEIEGPVDLSDIERTVHRRHSLDDTTLLAGKLYLGISREEISLPANVLGIINTRSTYARVGLEMARSSLIIAPGFGIPVPTPLVFEITTLVDITGLSSSARYAFASLFELPENVEVTSVDYWSIYPLPLI